MTTCICLAGTICECLLPRHNYQQLPSSLLKCSGFKKKWCGHSDYKSEIIVAIFRSILEILNINFTVFIIQKTAFTYYNRLKRILWNESNPFYLSFPTILILSSVNYLAMYSKAAKNKNKTKYKKQNWKDASYF